MNASESTYNFDADATLSPLLQLLCGRGEEGASHMLDLALKEVDDLRNVVAVLQLELAAEREKVGELLASGETS